MLKTGAKTSICGKAVISIGVTGHRFLSEVPKISAGIDRALDRIEHSFGTASWQVSSLLAEGADRLTARRILRRGNARLLVILPLPREDYLMDFTSPASKQEFLELLKQADQVIQMPPAPSREQAYAAAGAYLLDHCDLLLAVWDGLNAQGKGGTGKIAAAARRRNIPLAWVMAGNREPGTERPTSLGKDQGKPIFENFPD
jgi:hypothetical protein